jgi:hypothetical protein
MSRSSSPTHTSGRARRIDLLTLALTAAASAGAAFTVSKIWAPGTLASAALTPVLVALLSEALRRPTEAVSRAVPVRGVVRSAQGDGDAGGPGDHAHPPPRVAQQAELSSPVSTYRTQRPRRWQLAALTGLLGFAVFVVVLTVPELVTGGSASGPGQTTLFGGASSTHDRTRQKTTTTQVRTTPGPTKTVTVPAPTPTTPAPTTTSPPTVTTPPAVTAPATPPTTTAPPPP